ncbi:MAG: peptidase S41, partial [Flavobacterium sp.]|nr:peptidase S41 [Flavobacterium sp.]
ASYFVFEQLDKERQSFASLSFAQVMDKLNKTDVYFNNFRSYIATSGLMLNLEGSKERVKRYLAAEFARQLFDDNKYYQLVLKEDPMVKRVLNKK